MRVDRFQAPAGQRSATMGVRVIANARSGAVLSRGTEAFVADVVAAFAAAGAEADVRLAEGDDVASALAAALSISGLRVVIAGGDGTLMRLLPVILREGRPVGLLPLGTVNLLGKDLGFTGDLAHDARIAAGDETQRVSLALIGNILFHSNAGVGILGRMAREREDARRRFPFSRVMSFTWAAIRTLVLARTISVDIEVDRDIRHLEADAVLVTNNAFDDATLRRRQLDEGLLEVHIVTAPDLRTRLDLAFAILRGGWRKHPALQTLRCRAMRLERRDRARTRVAVDGELLTMRGPIAMRATNRFIEVYGRKPE